MKLPRTSHGLLALALVPALAMTLGCKGDGNAIHVDLRSDLVAGEEVVRVRTLVGPAGSESTEAQAELSLAPSDDLFLGVRIAELDGLAAGTKRVRVELYDRMGRLFISRNVTLELRGTSGMVVVVTRSCRDVTCPAPGGAAELSECFGGRCVSPECGAGDPTACGAPACDNNGDCSFPASCILPVCSNGVCLAALDPGACAPTKWCDPESGCTPRSPPLVDGGVSDGGSTCDDDGDCDDAIDCTIDRCMSGACDRSRDDTRCTAGPGGACIGGFGCQYDGCSPATCVARPCETARCEGTTCVREPACAPDQTCCGGACVASGCDDGDPCTDDACGAAGCQHVPNVDACDDGVFCNGADTCAGGECIGHAGNPCGGGSTCSEASRTCVGCLDDPDCPSPLYGTWSACAGYSDVCDESGTRTRTVTSFRCVSGTCTPSSADETEGCGRTTGGTVCAASTYDMWSVCGGFTAPCDESGTETRTRTDYACSGGSCAGTGVGESRGCTRVTDGMTCMATSYGGWGVCTGFTSDCDTTGMRFRSVTNYACDTTETCVGSAGTPESEPCTRMTDGDTCVTGCRFSTCSGGSCTPAGPPCSGRCCEPGICVCSTCMCP